MRQHNVTIVAEVRFETVILDRTSNLTREQAVDEAMTLFGEESDQSLDGDRQWSISRVTEVETESVVLLPEEIQEVDKADASAKKLFGTEVPDE